MQAIGAEVAVHRDFPTSVSGRGSRYLSLAFTV